MQPRHTNRHRCYCHDPESLARLHGACFTAPRPWSAAEFAALLASPGVILVSGAAGFARGRTAADEAELLTLAVPFLHPEKMSVKGDESRKSY